MRIALGYLLIFLLSICHLSGIETPGWIEKSQSPNGALGLSIVTTNGETSLSLTSLGTKAVLADVVLPKTIPTVSRFSTNTTVLWKRDNTGVAVSFSGKTNSLVFVCVKVRGDSFKWVDLRIAEGPNLGVLGRARSDFVRVEDTPTRWVDETDHTLRMVYVRTRFWDKHGKRYTVEQEFSISPTGEIGWK